jgi:non-heme chloroperoxidase
MNDTGPAFGFRPEGRRHRVTAPDGVELEVREWGDPAGKPLLLVTGVAQSYLSFVRQFAAPELQGFRIVAYDPRGHGLSDKPLGDAWYQEGRRWSGDVLAVMRALRLERPVLAGWSLGGRIVRQYLVDHGDDKLAGLAFLSCRPVEVPEVVGSGNEVMGRLRLDDLGSRIEVAEGFLRSCFAAQPHPADFTFMLAYNMLCPFEVRLQIGKWGTPPEISSQALRRVRVPTLIVHGDADVLVLRQAAAMTHELIPHATCSIHQGIGHSVFFEAPERFNAELLGLMRAAQAAPAANGG